MTGPDNPNKETAGYMLVHAEDMARERLAQAVDTWSMRTLGAAMVIPLALADGKTCETCHRNTGLTLELVRRAGHQTSLWVGSLRPGHSSGTAVQALRRQALGMPMKSPLSAQGLQGASLASCLHQL